MNLSEVDQSLCVVGMYASVQTCIRSRKQLAKGVNKFNKRRKKVWVQTNGYEVSKDE